MTGETELTDFSGPQEGMPIPNSKPASKTKLANLGLIRRNATILAEFIRKNIIPDPSILDKHLLEMENKIAEAVKQAIETLVEKIEQANNQLDEKNKLTQEQLHSLLVTLLTDSEDPKLSHEDRAKGFLGPQLLLNGSEDTQMNDNICSSVCQAVTSFNGAISKLEGYCDPAYFIGLPNAGEHSNQMIGYVNNLVRIHLYEKAESITPDQSNKETYKQEVTKLTTEVNEFKGKHRVTKESGVKAMQLEHKKGVLAAIGWACLGVTLGITLGGLGFFAGAFIGTLLTGGNAGMGVAAGLGAGGMIVAAITAATYIKASNSLDHANEAKAQKGDYLGGIDPQAGRQKREDDARKEGSGLDILRGFAHYNGGIPGIGKNF